MKFFIHTYGCQMNTHESEKIAALMEGVGFLQAEREADASILIFNTCCIRNTAEQKIISHIGNAGRRKKQSPDMIICIVGCLSQRANSAAELKRKFPFVDVILGTHNISDIAKLVQEKITSKKALVNIVSSRNIENDIYPIKRQNGDTFFINITYGCENYCSYCIVPYVRGKLLSRDISVIESEFDEILKNPKTENGKTKTIFLLGQNVNSYSCPRTNTNFVGLLERLSQKSGDYQINFLSSHPKDFSKELADTIAANAKIERNIHLPMQSGCDKILKAMNRGYTVAEYEMKIKYLRMQVPNVHITTDIICGFPGETEDDFKETIETVKRINFNAAFVFPYSRRSGTVADRLEGQLDMKTKRRRTTELINIMRQMQKNKNA